MSQHGGLWLRFRPHVARAPHRATPLERNRTVPTTSSTLHDEPQQHEDPLQPPESVRLVMIPFAALVAVAWLGVGVLEVLSSVAHVPGTDNAMSVATAIAGVMTVGLVLVAYRRSDRHLVYRAHRTRQREDARRQHELVAVVNGLEARLIEHIDRRHDEAMAAISAHQSEVMTAMAANHVEILRVKNGFDKLTNEQVDGRTQIVAEIQARTTKLSDVLSAVHTRTVETVGMLRDDGASVRALVTRLGELRTAVSNLSRLVEAKVEGLITAETLAIHLARLDSTIREVAAEAVAAVTGTMNRVEGAIEANAGTLKEIAEGRMLAVVHDLSRKAINGPPDFNGGRR